MSFNAKKAESSGGKIDPIEIGTYPGRLVQLIDLGVQKRKPFQGKEKDPIQTLWTTYELVSEFLKGEDGEDDPTKPRFISESFPFYNLDADRAKSTARYTALDPKMECEGNWDQVVTNEVAVTVVHNESGGKIYANIGDTSPVMKGMVVPELVNDPLIFSLDDPDLDVFNELPEFLQERIKGNINFEGSKLEALLSGKEPEAPQEEGDENPYG